ncbi:MAG TPA: Uma2 family endonuclease [Planctomycetaceae bacterium]|nr:Uma2 family endonuclease [Planctomycetaceae bacterium]
MSFAPKLQSLSVEEYLAGEEHAKHRHEYVGGFAYAQAGGTNAHNLIASNVHGELFAQLRGKPCRALNSDTKIRVRRGASHRFYYPDASVVCEFNAANETFQDKPKAIFEVLSEATRRIDINEKCEAYLTLESLEYYVLIEQDVAFATVWARDPDKFTQSIAEGLDASIALPTIGCQLSMQDIYDGLGFAD